MCLGFTAVGIAAPPPDAATAAAAVVAPLLHLHFPTRSAVYFLLDQVSVIGHSLGSIITHDILMAQPVKGETGLAEGAISQDIPVLK